MLVERLKEELDSLEEGGKVYLMSPDGEEVELTSSMLAYSNEGDLYIMLED